MDKKFEDYELTLIDAALKLYVKKLEEYRESDSESADLFTYGITTTKEIRKKFGFAD